MYSLSRHPHSIVAVHGLYGDAEKSWVSRHTGKSWLRDVDMLPHALPRARIMVWSYNADVHAWKGNTSSDGIMEHAHTLVAQLQADREVGDHFQTSDRCIEYLLELLTWFLV